MPYDARQIANWFITRAQQDGQTVSIMELLKLTYIAHGWHLETQKAPLFSNKIEAWQYGPVIPDVYNSFRRQGVSVQTPLEGFGDELEPDTTSLLDQVWKIYGHLSAFRLSDITHVRGGPWDLAYRLGGRFSIIPDDIIRDHYVQIRQKAQAATND